MGQPKLLLPLGDKPVIQHCIDTLSSAGISEIVVVVNVSGNDIIEKVRELPATIAVNNISGSDMAESVRTGLRALKGSPSGILVCLSDHPLVSPETLKTIIRQHHKTPESILIPAYHDHRGHPTLFPAALVSQLLTKSGITLRDLIREQAQHVLTLDVGDDGVVLDMDTEEDYKRLLDRFGGGRE